MKPDTKPVALVVGASSGLGRNLAEQLAVKGYDLIISSRDTRDLQVLAMDLQIRYKTKVFIVPVDLLSSEFSGKNFLQLTRSISIDIDSLFLIAGGSYEENEIDLPDEDVLTKSFELNTISISKIFFAFLNDKEYISPKHCWLVSSIAAPVPRSRNIAYSASKAALESLFYSARHYCSAVDNPIFLNLLRLGYMDTGFTFGKKLLFPVSNPKDVAYYMIKNLKSNKGLHYFPAFWKYIIFVLKILPWALYKRIRF